MKKVCRHFGECGGCSLQDIPYRKQIAEKKKLLSYATGIRKARIVKSPQVWGFRNKMEFSFGDNSLGLHQKGRYDKVIDLQECPVFGEDTGELLDAVRNFAAKHSIPFYKRRSNSGVMRYLIARRCVFTGEKMVVLVVGGPFSLEKEFASALEQSVENIKSVIVARQPGRGDTSFTSDYSIAGGREYINMKIGSMNMEISPYTFFQPNSYTVERMYSIIRKSVKRPSRVLDLFSGAGSIALFLAGEGMEITAVEDGEQATRDAEKNLRSLAPSGKYEFVNKRVRQFLSSQRRRWDYVVIDPPRGGMSPKVWLHIKRLRGETGGPEKIIYVSCSMKNLAGDIKFIKNNTDWRIKKVTGVDQFVHTPHLEAVLEMET